jgi:hypothetical protein
MDARKRLANLPSAFVPKTMTPDQMRCDNQGSRQDDSLEAINAGPSRP